MKKIQLLILGLGLLVSSCKNDDYTDVSKLDTELELAIISSSNNQALSYYILPASDNYLGIPQDVKNPITTEKVYLGKLLFHETGLGVKAKNIKGMNTYSCASCHHSAAGFQAGKRQGIGDGGLGFGALGELRHLNEEYSKDSVDIQPIKSPTVLNVAFQKLMLWNGQFGATDMNVGTESQWTTGTPKEVNHLGFEGVETQAIAGIKVHRMDINEELITKLGYKELFDNAFSDIPKNERYSIKNAGLAIAAYERTILANKAPFQEWLKGNKNALNEKEKKGAIIFFNKGKCYSCHNGPSLGSMEFAALGMKDLTGGDVLTHKLDMNTRKGRGGFTKKPEDDYKFKVPQLYNISSNGFYGHGSSFTSIKEVIIYKNKAVKENIGVPFSLLDERFKPLGLTEEEINYLTFFIENGLNDPDLKRYTPKSVMSGNCFPNNDTETRQQLGWDN